MIRLSLCMIVKDEEENLPPCLESMAGLADEVIVVDTGSRDRTPEIAAAFGARCFRFPWRDDFSEARNFSIQQATGDYVFWMDADDRLPPGSRDVFTGLKRKLSTEKRSLALFFMIRSAFGEGRGANRFKQVRLFPRIPEAAFEGRIHEQVIPSLARQGVVFMDVDIEIHHSGYRNRDERIAKAVRNLAILEKDDPTPINLIYRADMLEVLGRREEAARLLLEALKSGEWLRRLEGWYEKGVADLAGIWLREGKTGPCECLLRRGLAYVPNGFLLLLLMAEVMIRKRNLGHAVRYLDLAKENPPAPGPVASNPERGLSRLFFLMGECRFHSGDPEGALSAYLKSLRWVPGNRDAVDGMKRLAAAHERAGAFSKAVRVLDEVSTESSLEDHVRLMCLCLKDRDLSRFPAKAEKVMDLCSMEPHVEIDSVDDMALLLLGIAEGLPETPGRGEMIGIIHDALAGFYHAAPAAGAAEG